MTSGKLRMWALFVVLNLFGCALAYIAHLKGWVDLVLGRDESSISVVIAAVGAFGLLLCFGATLRLNHYFDDLSKDLSSGGNRFERYLTISLRSQSDAVYALETHLARKMGWIGFVGTLLPSLGLLGTVVGLIIALDYSRFEDVESISEVIDELFKQMGTGVGVAFLTTLVGMLGWLWHKVNVQILENESLRIVEEFIWISDRHIVAKKLEAREKRKAKNPPAAAPTPPPAAISPPEKGEDPPMEAKGGVA